MEFNSSSKSNRCTILFITLYLLTHFTNGSENVFTIEENVPVMTKVGSVEISKNDPRLLGKTDVGVLLYSLIRQRHGRVEDFILRGSDIVTIREIDREEICEPGITDCVITLGVHVSDRHRGGSFHTTFPAYVHISDVNDNVPTFTDDVMYIGVDEDMTVNAVIRLDGATDKDSGTNSQISYSGNWNRTLFALTTSTNIVGYPQLSLTLLTPLDADVTSRYEFTIVATDDGTPKLSSSLTVYLTVNDVNDNVPICDRSVYSVNLSESYNVRENFIRIHATDPDSSENGHVFYQIAQHNTPLVKSTFSIHKETGYVHLLKPLDYDTKPKNIVIIAVRDNGTPPESSECKIVVSVIDENDNPPSMTVLFLSGPERAEVTENATIGSLVAYITVSDADSLPSTTNCSVHQSIVRLVPIYPNSYHMVLNKSVHRSTATEYPINITCTDSIITSHSISRDFVLHVTDINDHSPVFAHSDVFVSLPEQFAHNFLMTRVEAMDNDTGLHGQVRYSFIRTFVDDNNNKTNDIIRETKVGRSDNDNLDSLNFQDPKLSFTLNRKSGEIRVTGLLDRELVGDYRFLVVARDGTPPYHDTTATVSVVILDVNDHDPEILTKMTAFNITENQAIGEYIGHIRATDRDSGLNSQLSFSTNSELITVGKLTGVIRSFVRFDREKQDFYNIRITVADKGDPQRNTSVRLSLRILDENDNRPKFIFPVPGNDTIIVDINDIDHVIGHIHAADADIDSHVTYHCVPNDNVVVDSVTGSVTLTSRPKLAEHNSAMTYNVTVIARDRGNPTREVTSQLYILLIWQEPTTASAITVMTADEHIQLGNINVIIICTLLAATIVICAILLALIIFLRKQRNKKQPNPKRTTPKTQNIDQNNINLDCDQIHDLDTYSKPKTPDIHTLNSNSFSNFDKKVTFRDELTINDIELTNTVSVPNSSVSTFTRPNIKSCRHLDFTPHTNNLDTSTCSNSITSYSPETIISPDSSGDTIMTYCSPILTTRSVHLPRPSISTSYHHHNPTPHNNVHLTCSPILTTPHYLNTPSSDFTWNQADISRSPLPPDMAYQIRPPLTSLLCASQLKKIDEWHSGGDTLSQISMVTSVNSDSGKGGSDVDSPPSSHQQQGSILSQSGPFYSNYV